jgi:nicotinamide-nucleotide amidase
LQETMGDNLWGADDDTLVGIVGTILRGRWQTLATMESYTGGLLAASFSGVDESSGYYRGGVVIGSREAELDHISLDNDTDGSNLSCEEIACSMVDTVRQRLEADIGICIAGPGAGQEQENVVAIAVGDGKKVRTRESKWPTSRRDVRQWIALAALYELRQFLS